MKISIKKGDLSEQKCDFLVLNLFEGVKEFGGATGAVDAVLGGLLKKIVREEKFDAKQGSTLLVRTDGKIPARKVLLVGLGKKESFEEDSVRQAAAVSIQKAKSVNSRTVVSILHGAGIGGLDASTCGRAMAEGVRLGAYSFSKYKSEKDKQAWPKSFEIVTTDGRAARSAQNGIELGETYAKGTILARDLGNEPAHNIYPATLVEIAQSVAKENKGVRVRVYDRKQLEKMGADASLGIAKGSDHEPFMVHLTYKPVKARKKIALVGKAVTFDSGGISLKPGSSMETMKIDMAGSAAVLGAFSVMAQLKPKAEVHGIFIAVENMPSGKAIKPGDIVRAMNKKTIEVLNTDAEGRVTLADSLSYAVKQKPDMIIDLATLTGACMVALGEEVSGLMSNDRNLAEALLKAAKDSGEGLWELPLEKRYKKLLKSDVADLKNIAGKYGGAVTAGLFLEEFVDGTPWAHLDIAGPSFAERPLNSYTNKGASGVGVRTLLEFLRNI